MARAPVRLQLAGTLWTRQLRIVATGGEQEHGGDGRDREGHAGDGEQRSPQARLLVRRAAGRARPLRRPLLGGTPAALDSSSSADARSAANASRSSIAS